MSDAARKRPAVRLRHRVPSPKIKVVAKSRSFEIATRFIVSSCQLQPSVRHLKNYGEEDGRCHMSGYHARSCLGSTPPSLFNCLRRLLIQLRKAGRQLRARNVTCTTTNWKHFLLFR